MRQLSALAIVPSNGVKERLAALLQNDERFFCKILVDGADDYQHYITEYASDFHVIVSCPAAYTAVSESTLTPVVQFEVSFADILRAVLMSQSYTNDLALVGKAPVVEMGRTICDLLHLDMKLAVAEAEALPPVLDALKNDGCSLIIGDMQTSAVAREAGLGTVTITPGNSTLTAAMDQAYTIATAVFRQTERLTLMQTALSASNQMIIVFDEGGEILYASSAPASYAPAFSYLKSKPLDEVPNKQMIKLDDSYWGIEKRNLYLQSKKVICLYVQKQYYDLEDIAMRGIMVASHSDLAKHEISEGHLDGMPTMRHIAEDARNYVKLPSPAIIFGELGVGKNIFADIIHKYSKYSENHVVVVDCSIVELPTWAKLLHETASIFSKTDVVFFFKNFEQTPPQIHDTLIQYLQGIHERGKNKFVFSCNCFGPRLPNLPILSFLINDLDASRIYVPPLRERPGEFGSLSSIYISALSTELNSQIIGLEPNAVALLKNYSWPGNLNQFRRFISELIASSKGFYISAKTVATEMKREIAESTLEQVSALPQMDLTGTLEEIEMRILLRVLQEEGQNQTSAAKRLGISRSTFWRKLKA